MTSLWKRVVQQCDLTPIIDSSFKLVLLLSCCALMSATILAADDVPPGLKLRAASSAKLRVADFASLRTADFYKWTAAQKATYVFVPWMSLGEWKHIEKWDEDTFKRLGCTYTTQDPRHIASLVGIIRRGELMPQDVPKHSGGFSRLKGSDMMAAARQAVYLTFADGSEARFMIGENKAVELNFPPEFDDTPYYAQRTLPWYLLFWASQLGTTPATIDPEVEAECARQIKIRIYEFTN